MACLAGIKSEEWVRSMNSASWVLVVREVSSALVLGAVFYTRKKKGAVEKTAEVLW